MEGNNIQTILYTLKQKGNLSYSYNPFYNYQTDENLYEKDGFIIPEGKAINPKNGQILDYYKEKEGKKYYKDSYNNLYEESELITIDLDSESDLLYAAKGSLINLDTSQLNFDLNHPVDITVQPSYDGSVNLILNDNKNIPRLINSRFSVREKNTYEIVDRIGENDTNIYNSKTFEKDSSLYFQFETNPIISLKSLCKGNLLVGQYCFYLTYCDADDNESDYIAESGPIPVFIGSDSTPSSMDGGIKNQNSNKGISLKITNLDKSYNYLRVYYVRYFADYQQHRVSECKKLYNKIPINFSTLELQITGNEQVEDIDANILNITRFNPKSIYTQAQCKNILFFGNIVQNYDNYRELTDCALRISPKLKIEQLNTTDIDYSEKEINNAGYYSISNMYNKTGYFNEEFYRFGVVFIYNNGTLSNVYNTLGGILTNNNSITTGESFYYKEKEEDVYLIRNYIKYDDNGWIKDSVTFDQLNSKGVCKIQYNGDYDDNTIIGIQFQIPNEVITFLKETLGIRGLFFVRQKRIPNIITQCYLLPHDNILEAPVIRFKNIFEEQDVEQNVTECFVTQDTDRKVTNDYSSRLYVYKDENSLSNNSFVGICPDFLLDQPYYNQIFNGSKFKLKKVKRAELENDNSIGYEYINFFTNKIRVSKKGMGQNRFYKESKKSQYLPQTENTYNNIIINTVTENVPTVAIKDKVFKLEKGSTEESFRFEYAEVNSGEYSEGKEKATDKVNEATNIVRGMYSPYLAIYSPSTLETNCLYNIYLENSNTTEQEFLIRMNNKDVYYSIGNRYNFEDISDKIVECWRGDCYLNTFTYRVNRNFNDPTLPNNDKIIDENTWKDNYDITKQQNWTKISRADLNAIQMGSWITFKLRSYMNYALRSDDHSYVSEEAVMGSPRSFYPKSSLLYRGANKLPDSYLYNDAYRATLGFKCYVTLEDINYLKNTFHNRIQYSAIAIRDSFKNNYRYSLSTYFRDYSSEYGGITKLIEFNGNLLVIFEHGIGLAAINERILMGEGDGQPVFINTKNVLPEELVIVSDTYGSQWPESVIKSENGIVYGVDTVNKKIWSVTTSGLSLLSDLKVNSFLTKNITLSQQELTPFIGLKNVKTHYNNNKKDVIFTFYNEVYQDEEKVWSLCFNELLQQFITFYSWIPSYSENIDTQFFTFNRNTSKYMALLSRSNFHVAKNTGILLDTPVIEVNDSKIEIPIRYRDVSNEYSTILGDGDEIKHYRENYNKKLTFELLSDHWKNYKLFEFIKDGESNVIYLNCTNIQELKDKLQQRKIILLNVQTYDEDGMPYKNPETIALTSFEILSKFSDNFYHHGQSGLFNDIMYPCYWYDEQHPFEFEFVVNDNIGYQKIFNNLIIISNKAQPESFHFEIEGDNYEFSKDKRNMYYRQEMTKELYQSLGSDILFNRNYRRVANWQDSQEQYYNGNSNDIPQSEENYTDFYKKVTNLYPMESHYLTQQVKSTIFPLYYERIDTYDDIYHKYYQMRSKDENYDFKNLSGSEVKWDPILNQFNIVTHIKNSPIDLNGVLRGNSKYKEGKWNIQIPSITYLQKNEEEWPGIKDSDESVIRRIPPIVLNSQYIPKDIDSKEIEYETLKNIITGRQDYIGDEITDFGDYLVSGNSWTLRKETEIRDKWIKIRVRYSGKNLAIIHSLITLYNISYS